MADTIVNTPGNMDRTDNVVGWVIAAVIALALFLGVIALFRNTALTPTTPITTTEVNIPNTGGTPAGMMDGTGGSGTGTGTGTTGSGTGTGTGTGAGGSY